MIGPSTILTSASNLLVVSYPGVADVGLEWVDSIFRFVAIWT